ncbi:MAG: DMT family transporter, partial [Pseudomonadota bacterium]
VPAAVAATGQLCASTLLMIPLVLLIDQPWTLPMPSAATVWSIIGLALASTAFAYILFFRILQTAGATNISLVTLLVPVSAIILGAVFLDEALSWTHFLGMALIAAGLACIDGRLLPNKRPASRRDA